MKNVLITFMALLSAFSLMSLINIEKTDPKNPEPFVDYDAFGKLIKEVEKHREQRLVSLEDFLKKSKEENTIILDTRSKNMYDLKHVKGAIHLNFSDFTQYSLDALMNKYAEENTQILIYCNNNFTDIGNSFLVNNQKVNNMDRALMTKMVLPKKATFQKVIPQKKQLIQQHNKLSQYHVQNGC